jgi:hypothetical protein
MRIAFLAVSSRIVVYVIYTRVYAHIRVDNENENNLGSPVLVVYTRGALERNNALKVLPYRAY